MRSERIRCYLPPEAWDLERPQVSLAQARHLTRVLRLKPNDRITCFDGEGHEAEGLILEATREGLFLKLGERRSLPRSPWEMTLGIALPRHGKMDQIVTQATELGVNRIIPLSTARGVVRIPAGEVTRKQERLRQVAIEALKQSSSSRLPILSPMAKWVECVRSFSGYDLVLMATVPGPHEDLRALFSRSPGRILLLIGPEGDFSPREIEEASGAGAHRISLGSSILKCETAAVCGIGIVSFLLREQGAIS